MTCPKCGAENSDAVSRCLKCGSSLVVSVEAETWAGGTRAASADETWAPNSKAAAPRSGSDETWASANKTPTAPSDAQTWVGSTSDAPTALPFSRSAYSNAPTAVGFGLGATAAVQGQVDFGPRYQVEKLLGQGGMGAVYKAYDKDLDRTVALKLIRPELTVHPESMMRFKQELLLASKISHKNILRIHDLGDAAGMKFISMAYIEGHDLSDLLHKTGRLPVARALHIARQLCAALQAAQNEGVVHRDFKPQNIMLDQSDNVYVSDFGLAKSLGEEGGMTMTGELLGTPRYMAPEQVEGKKVDARTDLYALGLVIYEMVTGDVPFQNETTLTMMYKRANEAPPSPKNINPEVPDWLVRIIMKCLERDPANRYQNAQEILDDINAGRGPSASAQSMSIGIPRMQVTVSKRRWILVGLVALALAIAVATPLVIRYRRGQATAEESAARAKYVAVLPLKIAGDQGSLDYIANGVVEALTAKLFQLKDVRVASSSALEKLGKNADSVAEIGKALGVNLVVSGTIQGAGDKLRIVMNMDDAKSGQRLWTQEFSGVTGDLLTLEDQIYNKVTSALELKLSNEELARTSAHPTENIGAYQLYLQGRNAMRGKLDAKTAQVAIDYFDKARKQDPEFALAYTGIADASLRMYKESKDTNWADKAVGAAEQAARLNDNLPEVHFALGSVYGATGKSSQAIAELQRALQLAPNSDDGYRRLADAYRSAGRKTEALDAYRKAISINSYYWYNYLALGLANLSFGDYDKALEAFTKVIELAPKNAVGYSDTGIVYFQKSQWNESIPWFQKAVEVDPNYQFGFSNLGTAYFYLKRYDEAVKMFEKAVELNPNQEQMMGNLADAYRWSGQKDKANTTYDKAIALAQKELQVNPRQAEALRHVALYYAKKGDDSLAQNFLRRARSVDPNDVDLLYTAAVVDTLGKRPQEAIQALKTAFEKGYPVSMITNDPEFGSLANQPQYQSLIKQYTQQAANSQATWVREQPTRSAQK